MILTPRAAAISYNLNQANPSSVRYHLVRMPVLPAASLPETELFTRLQELGNERRRPLALPGNVLDICNDVAARLKRFPAVHTQFTLHDETHCLRVVQLMASVASGGVRRLNGAELALLILAAYHHDQGMIVDPSELDAIRSSSEWKTHEQDWAADYPNYREAAERSHDASATPADRDRAAAVAADLRAAMWTDFIRRSHGKRSARFVSDTYRADPRLNINSRSVADLLATICESHVHPPETITASNGYAFDELVGTDRVNVALLAYILRLADILDFDRERTPAALYRAISFTSATSVTEWHKHLSIVGWSVAPDRIVFSAECEHPAYERAIRHFMDDIDSELAAVQEWNRHLPAAFEAYTLNLPVRVDRDRIGPRIDPVTRAASYSYQDLEFSLSRDEIVKLLMTDGLYQHRGLFIRELLQNA